MEAPASQTVSASHSFVIADEATLRRIIAEELARVLQPTGPSQDDDPDRLMTADEVAHLLHIDRRTLRRLELQGDIPAPALIGERTKRWRRSVVEKWLRDREARAAKERRR